MNTAKIVHMLKAYSLIMFSAITIGCAAYQNEPVVYESTFGHSVTQVKQAQILNPQAALNPPLDPPKHLDGEAGEIVLENYRKDFSQAETVDSIDINLGGDVLSGSSGGGGN